MLDYIRQFKYNETMIDRYSREEIKKIWDLDSKFNYYLKVELAVCEAYFKLGTIPEKSLNEIKEKASFSIERIIPRNDESFAMKVLPVSLRLPNTRGEGGRSRQLPSPARRHFSRP